MDGIGITIPIGTLINISTKIAEYFQLFEGVLTKTNKLVHQAFKSGIENLRYANKCTEANQMDYIKRAKDRFIDAIVVEDPKEQVLALGGLAFCQYLLGEKENADYSLKRIEEVQLNVGQAVKDLLREKVADSFLSDLFYFDDTVSEEKLLLILKQKLPIELKKIMTDGTCKPL